MKIIISGRKKKLRGRAPVHKPTKQIKSKKTYTRKSKYKERINE